MDIETKEHHFLKKDCTLGNRKVQPFLPLNAVAVVATVVTTLVVAGAGAGA